MKPRILVLGYGNPGRLDDGLGPALAREVDARSLGEDVEVETAYQLNVEDAAEVARHDVVVFADADATCAAPFELRRIEPRAEAAFTTHSVEPEGVLSLAQDHFGAAPTAFVLGIRGYEFGGFGERLSAGARSNLAAATDWLCRELVAGGDHA